MKRVSVIMPLFNAQKYLPEALQSILTQTYRDFELICINDCSTDNTEKILVEFQRRDKRIRILENTERLGAGRSRNRGLQEAVGEYVIFLDGDDVFEEELLETARDTMKKNKTDIVFFEFLHTSSETIYNKRSMERSEKFIEAYCRTPFALDGLDPRDVARWSGATANKMYRRQFLIDHEIEFQDLPSSNDVYFSKMALYCAKSIIWLNDRRIMVYAREHSETSRISSDRDPMCAYYALEKLARELRKRNLMDRLAGFYYCTFVSDLFYALEKVKNEERKRGFYVFLQNEGIPKCIAYGGQAYILADSYDKYMLDNFINNTYESSWFHFQDTYFQFYLKKNGQAILEYVKDKLEKGKRIVLWGVGANGKSVLDYLDEHMLRIFALVDMDTNKQGTIAYGYKISDPAAVVQKADYVMVTSKQLFCELSDADILRNTGIVIVNLLELILEKVKHTCK